MARVYLMVVSDWPDCVFTAGLVSGEPCGHIPQLLDVTTGPHSYLALTNDTLRPESTDEVKLYVRILNPLYLCRLDGIIIPMNSLDRPVGRAVGYQDVERVGDKTATSGDDTRWVMASGLVGAQLRKSPLSSSLSVHTAAVRVAK